MSDATPIEVEIVTHADGTGTAHVYAITPTGRELVHSADLDWQHMATLAAACPDEPDDDDE